jgi:hypothetical protein
MLRNEVGLDIDTHRRTYVLITLAVLAISDHLPYVESWIHLNVFNPLIRIASSRTRWSKASLRAVRKKHSLGHLASSNAALKKRPKPNARVLRQTWKNGSTRPPRVTVVNPSAERLTRSYGMRYRRCMTSCNFRLCGGLLRLHLFGSKNRRQYMKSRIGFPTTSGGLLYIYYTSYFICILTSSS